MIYKCKTCGGVEFHRETCSAGYGRVVGTPHGIAKEYFPDADDETIERIIWNKTGYPQFWNIPEDGATPEACFRKQLRAAGGVK